MKQSRWIELCAYMASMWGRELTQSQKAAGYKMLGGLSDESVEGGVLQIAESGRETLPPIPLIFKHAQAFQQQESERLPQLPAGDSLTDLEHEAVMIMLKAKQTPEQRRRAERVKSETKGLPMRVRLALAGELLMNYSKIDARAFDLVFDERVSAALATKQHER